MRLTKVRKQISRDKFRFREEEGAGGKEGEFKSACEEKCHVVYEETPDKEVTKWRKGGGKKEEKKENSLFFLEIS